MTFKMVYSEIVVLFTFPIDKIEEIKIGLLALRYKFDKQ